MKTVCLIRLDRRNDRTLGRLLIFNGCLEIGTFYSLELPYRDNRRNESSIPAGSYVIEPWISPRFGECFRVRDVPGRDAILVHPGNFPDDTQGCILAGFRLADIDRDGLPDAVTSRYAIELMRQLLTEPARLVVVEG